VAQLDHRLCQAVASSTTKYFIFFAMFVFYKQGLAEALHLDKISISLSHQV
jgi:hypothetical protein